MGNTVEGKGNPDWGGHKTDDKDSHYAEEAHYSESPKYAEDAGYGGEEGTEKAAGMSMEDLMKFIKALLSQAESAEEKEKSQDWIQKLIEALTKMGTPESEEKINGINTELNKI